MAKLKTKNTAYISSEDELFDDFECKDDNTEEYMNCKTAFKELK